jgi:hypothetical protein
MLDDNNLIAVSGDHANKSQGIRIVEAVRLLRGWEGALQRYDLC